MSGALGGEVLVHGDPNYSSQKILMVKDQGAFVNLVLYHFFPPHVLLLANLYPVYYMQKFSVDILSSSFPRKLLSLHLPLESLSVISSLNQPLPLPLPLPQPLPCPL